MKFEKGMSSERYLSEVKENFKNNDIFEEIVKKSNYSSMCDVNKANRDFVLASIDYLENARFKISKGFTPSQGNHFELESEERKVLCKKFNCRTKERQNIFNPQYYNGVKGQNLFIYNLMEAVFDASLLVEPNMQNKFEVMVELYNSLVEVKSGCYIGYFESAVLYVDTVVGKIYRIKNHSIKKELKKGIIGFRKQNNDIYVRIPFNSFRVIEKGELVEKLWVEAAIQNSPSRPYNIFYLRGKTPEHKALRVHNHEIILLAKYGINAMKYTLSKLSMVACDHVDRNKKNNHPNNLEMICRVDNVPRALLQDEEEKNLLYSYNLNDYFEFIENCLKDISPEEEEKQKAKDIFWNVVFRSKQAKEIILAA